MKRKIIMISLILAIAGLTTFGFIRKSKFNNNSYKPSICNTSSKLFNTKSFEFKSDRINQDVEYRVRPGFSSGKKWSIIRKKLREAKKIDDIITDYPGSWITNYSSVKIVLTSDEIIMESASDNNIITDEQKALLNYAKINSSIDFIVKYKKKNSVKNVEEDLEMQISYLIVPETKAEYIGGYEQLITYLKENSANEIINKELSVLTQPSVSFIINELGKTENVKIIQTSGNIEVDNLLVKLIQQMIDWLPAKNEDGKNVKQQFTLDVGGKDVC